MRPGGPTAGDDAGGKALRGWRVELEEPDAGEEHQPPDLGGAKSRCASGGRLATYEELSAEVRSMRSVLVGVVALVMAVSGPAYGGSIDDTEPRPSGAPPEAVSEPAPVAQERLEVHQRAPFRDVVVEEYHNAGAELGMGIASTVLSIFYTPVRLAVGVVGAGVGGVEGWLTGGDLRTARSMWRPAVEGDYFIRPDHLDRTERYEWGNFRPVVRERYTLRGREPMLHEDEAVASIENETVPAGTVEAAPAEPQLEDAGDDR